jgi:hypothetical protein
MFFPWLRHRTWFFLAKYSLVRSAEAAIGSHRRTKNVVICKGHPGSSVVRNHRHYYRKELGSEHYVYYP